MGRDGLSQKQSRKPRWSRRRIVVALLVAVSAWTLYDQAIVPALAQDRPLTFPTPAPSPSPSPSKGEGADRGSSAAFNAAIDAGVIAFTGKDFTNALRHFEEAKAAGPGRPEPLYYLGLTFDQLDRPNEAVTFLRLALALDPHLIRARFALGVVLFGQEQYQEALPEFGAVERADPADVPSIWMPAMASYYQGLIHHRLEAYDRAVPQLLKAITLLPGVGRTAYYYAGIGLFRLGRLDEAQERFEDALKLATMDSEFARTIKTSLAEVERARRPTRRWALEVGAGVESDTNVVAWPESSPLPSLISRRSDRRWALTVQGHVDLVYVGRWTGRAGYGLAQSLYRELGDFDAQQHTAEALLIHQGRWLTSRLPYDFTYASLGGRDYLTMQAVAPSATVAWNSLLTTQLEYRYQDQDFRDSLRLPSNSDRDGFHQMVTLTTIVSSAAARPTSGGPRSGGNVRLVYAYDRDATRSRDWAYTGHRVAAGTDVPLPAAFTLGLEADYAMKQFEHPNSASATGEKRIDNILTFTVSVGYTHVGPFDLGLQYRSTKNGSNLALFDYSRGMLAATITGRL